MPMQYVIVIININININNISIILLSCLCCINADTALCKRKQPIVIGATTIGTGGDWSPQLLSWGTNNLLVPCLFGRSFQKTRNFTASSHQNAGFSIWVFKNFSGVLWTLTAAARARGATAPLLGPKSWSPFNFSAVVTPLPIVTVLLRMLYSVFFLFCLLFFFFFLSPSPPPSSSSTFPPKLLPTILLPRNKRSRPETLYKKTVSIKHEQFYWKIWREIKTNSPWVVTFSWQHSCRKKMTYKPSKLGQTGLFLVCNRSLSVSLCMQD